MTLALIIPHEIILDKIYYIRGQKIKSPENISMKFINAARGPQSD